MRLFIVCLCLFLVVPSVLASVEAGPFENVFFYYAYRIDTIVNADKHTIGKGCPASGSRKFCNFDEFVKYIRDPTQQWTGRTNIGNAEDPDVYQAAQQLIDSGCVNKRYDSTKILTFDIDAPNYFTLVEAVWKKTSANLRTDETGLKAQYGKISFAFELIYDARIGDMTRGLVGALNKRLGKLKAGWTCETTRRTLFSGYTIESVDLASTFARHPDMRDEIKTMMADVVENYPDLDSKANNHFKTLQALQAYQMRFVQTRNLGPCS